MSIQFRKAERSKARLRLALDGTSGSGKTFSSLILAKGLGGRTAFIDSENGSGELYAEHPAFEGWSYDIVTLAAPFTPEKYVEAIKAAEAAGYEIIIIDSLTHAWAGSGGVLDTHAKFTEKDKNKNSYTAWRNVTPSHNALIDAMLQTKCHVIATMRSKSDYVLETGSDGKQRPKKVGLAAVQREGTEYEFTAVLDIDSDHDAKASKDRTGLFSSPLPFRITEETGRELNRWLVSGRDIVPDCVRCKSLGTVVPSTDRRGEYDVCATCAAVYDEKQKVVIMEEEIGGIEPDNYEQKLDSAAIAERAINSVSQ